jgi:hypothetical protein
MALNVYTEMKTPVLEGSAHTYSTDLVLPNGQSVVAAQVSDIRLWVLDERMQVLNSRDNQSVKNANGGTLTDGHFTFQLVGADTLRQPDDQSQVQTRYLHLEFQMVGGLVHRHEVLWYVALHHRTP